MAFGAPASVCATWRQPVDSRERPLMATDAACEPPRPAASGGVTAGGRVGGAGCSGGWADPPERADRVDGLTYPRRFIDPGRRGRLGGLVDPGRRGRLGGLVDPGRRGRVSGLVDPGRPRAGWADSGTGEVGREGRRCVVRWPMVGSGDELSAWLLDRPDRVEPGRLPPLDERDQARVDCAAAVDFSGGPGPTGRGRLSQIARLAGVRATTTTRPADD